MTIRLMVPVWESQAFFPLSILGKGLPQRVAVVPVETSPFRSLTRKKAKKKRTLVLWPAFVNHPPIGEGVHPCAVLHYHDVAPVKWA
jgi:hypothetical protein